MEATTAPVKNARYILKKMFGHPNINPMRKANFTSPKPIPFPFVSAKSKKKKKNAPKAESKNEGREKNEVNTIKKKETILAGTIITSGIIPYNKSQKKITSNEDIIKR